MLICLACYGDRLATLVESATELRFYSVEQHAPVFHLSAPVPQKGVFALVDMLAAQRIDVLICGGLSGCVLTALQQSGVPVAPWIGGAAEEVAAAWAAGGGEAVNQLRMPGCVLGGCCGSHAGRGYGRGQIRKALRTRMRLAQITKAEKPS